LRDDDPVDHRQQHYPAEEPVRPLPIHIAQPRPVDAGRGAGAGDPDEPEPPGRPRPPARRKRLPGESESRAGNPRDQRKARPAGPSAMVAPAGSPADPDGDDRGFDDTEFLDLAL